MPRRAPHLDNYSILHVRALLTEDWTRTFVLSQGVAPP